MVELYQIRRVTGGQGLAAFHSYGHVADLQLGITEEADGEAGHGREVKKTNRNKSEEAVKEGDWVCRCGRGGANGITASILL
jgi:hypothetical protein